MVAYTRAEEDAVGGGDEAAWGSDQDALEAFGVGMEFSCLAGLEATYGFE